MAKNKNPRWFDETEPVATASDRKKNMKYYPGQMSAEMMQGEDMAMMEDAEMGMPMRVLAHAYVPWQYYEQAFSPREALMKGTLFPELWGAYPIPE